jgi:hypothetical protein
MRTELSVDVNQQPQKDVRRQVRLMRWQWYGLRRSGFYIDPENNLVGVTGNCYVVFVWRVEYIFILSLLQARARVRDILLPSYSYLYFAVNPNLVLDFKTCLTRSAITDNN